MRRCSSCLYSDIESQIVDVMICRRYPPKVVRNEGDSCDYSQFPYISPDGWCGEHQLKPSEIKKLTVTEMDKLMGGE